MTFNGIQQRALIEALIVLERGDTRQFEDVLWLRFGDEWTDVRGLLARRGYIEANAVDRELIELTSRGLKFVQNLQGHAAAKLETSQARRPSAEVSA